MAAAVKGGCIAAEEIAGHKHLKRTFLPVRRGFHALDRAFFHDVKVFGRIAFAKNEVVFSVAGFRKFPENALTILRAQDVEQGNMVKQTVGGNAGPFT